MSEIKFLFVTDSEVGAPIENGEGIFVLDPEGAHYVVDALISNELHRSHVFAPEINWYLRQTSADKEEKKEILKKLYEMRYVRYTHAPKKVYAINVNRTVMIIGESEEALALVKSAERLFEVTHILPSKLVHLEGKLGDFRARFLQSIEEEGATKEEEREALCAQLVLCDQKSHLYKNRGVECVNDYSDVDVLLRRIRDRIGHYTYKTAITYDATRCTYHHQENPACSACADICPTFGLSKDDTLKELIFSALDCTGCGKCVSVCLENAIDFAPFSQKAFEEVATLCEDKAILLVAEPYVSTLQGCEIPRGYIPFVVETDQFLSVFHFETLVKKSAHNVLFYTPDISEATHNALKAFNEASNSHIVELYQTTEALEAQFAFTCKASAQCERETELTQRIDL